MYKDFLNYLHKTEDGEMNTRKTYRTTKNRIREIVETDETDDLNDKVEFLKERLYKKIDACFIQFGLRGLTKIDESIADGLTEFIQNEREPKRNDRSMRLKRPIESRRERAPKIEYIEDDRIEDDIKNDYDDDFEDDFEEDIEEEIYDPTDIIAMASRIDIGDTEDTEAPTVKKVKSVADVKSTPTPTPKKKKPKTKKVVKTAKVKNEFGDMDLDAISESIDEKEENG